MKATSTFTSGILLILLASCMRSSPPARTTAATATADSVKSGDLVAEVSSLQFHSAFWPNLHHVLYAEAWANRHVAPYESRAQSFPAPLNKVVLRPDERVTWTTAIDYYQRELADKDLLFDDAMGEARHVLASASANASEAPAGLAPEHARVLAAAAPIYRAHWWRAHDHANRAWIEDTRDRVQALSPVIPDRLARLYGTPWFTSPVRVDVVFVANRQSAYTSNRPVPHITTSSTAPYTQGWAAAEIMFHEASHALVDPVRTAFDSEASTQAKSLPDLWHVALFYLSGEVVRQTLAARNIDYTPYVYAKGLFARSWKPLQTPIETHWRPYVDGTTSLTDAVSKVVAACPSG